MCGRHVANARAAIKIRIIHERENYSQQGYMTANQESVEQAIEKHVISREPYYLAVGKEVELFEAAYRAKLPIMLKGPTGCGKTRFIEYMAWRLRRPLVTVA
jgi:MoxR-like ATPase